MNTETKPEQPLIKAPEPQKQIPLAGEIPAELIPPKDIPEQVRINMDMDKRNASNATVIPGVQPPAPPADNKKKLPINPKGFTKIAIGIFIGLIVLIILYAFISATNIDTQFIKLTLSGHVFDAQTQQPLNEAHFFIDNIEVAKSNADGSYQISGLNPGTIALVIKAEGFDDLTDNVAVSRFLLNYGSTKDYSLTKSKSGTLKGKVLSNLPDYKFGDDTIILADNSFTVNEDGTFTIPVTKTGPVKFSYISPYFKDFEQDLNLTSGDNLISDIKLASAGDIKGSLKSWIKEDLVLNVKFFVENILQDQIQINADGTYLIKDLEVNKKYKIRVTADGYEPRDYDITIKQGPNQLFNFKLVEDGVATFPQLISANKFDLYTSEFDGSNKQNIGDNRINIYSKYYSLPDKKLYYMTTIDNIFNEGSNKAIFLPYSYDIATGQKTLLTSKTDGLVDTYANFIAKKMINTIYNKKEGTFSLEIMDLSGNNRTSVTAPISRLMDSVLADNGKVVIFLTSNDDNTLTLNQAVVGGETKTVATNKEITILDISEDGTKVLASRINSNTDLKDLVVYNLTTNETRTLKENFDGKDAQYVKGNNNKVVYYTKRAGVSNIYVFTIDQSKEDRITNLTTDYTVNYIYQESNLLFYATTKGLLVLDVNNPKTFKIVSEDAFGYVL